MRLCFKVLILALIISAVSSEKSLEQLKNSSLSAENIRAEPQFNLQRKSSLKNDSQKRATQHGSNIKEMKSPVKIARQHCLAAADNFNQNSLLKGGLQNNKTLFFVPQAFPIMAVLCEGDKYNLSELLKLCKTHRCSENGECFIVDQGTPIEREECLCNHGYTGAFCQYQIRSRVGLLVSFWIIVAIEVIFIFLGIYRHRYQKFYEPPFPPQRFVDILRDATKLDKKKYG